MLKRVFKRAAAILFAIMLPFLFFSASIAWAVNSQWFYTSGFTKQNVSATTGLDKEQLAQVAKGFISYWNSSEQRINIEVVRNGVTVPLFNENEIGHLIDVKTLFQFDYKAMFITGAYALGYILFSFFRRKRDNLRGLAKSVAWGSGLTLAFMVALGAVALLGANAFENFWWTFHTVIFTHGNWEFDPTKDYLVMLVPEGFWYDAVRDIVFATAGLAIVCGGAAIAHLRYHRERKPTVSR